jgi:hypothetical protein
LGTIWLRSGETSSANFLSFLEDTLAKLKNKTFGLIRLDSGFCSNEILEYLQQKSIDPDYAIGFLMRSNSYFIVMEFEIGYTDKEITPWGEMVFMRQMLDKIGLMDIY